MSNKPVYFNGEKYSVTSEYLSSIIERITQHITNNMSGSGATVDIGGVSYSISNEKVVEAVNRIASHVSNMSSGDNKIYLNGTSYSVSIPDETITNITNILGTPIYTGSILGQAILGEMILGK